MNLTDEHRLAVVREIHEFQLTRGIIHAYVALQSYEREVTERARVAAEKVEASK